MPTKNTCTRPKSGFSICWRKTLLGSVIGLLAGCSGAAILFAAFHAIPMYFLLIVAIVPTLTGLITGIFSKKRLSIVSDNRTQLSAQHIHIGSRIGLHAFLLRFGLNRGIFQTIVDKPQTQPRNLQALPTRQNQEKTLKSIEKQYPTITTISYDAQTNTPTSDTIGREYLASAHHALLSMDHTKQIPH